MIASAVDGPYASALCRASANSYRFRWFRLASGLSTGHLGWQHCMSFAAWLADCVEDACAARLTRAVVPSTKHAINCISWFGCIVSFFGLFSVCNAIASLVLSWVLRRMVDWLVDCWDDLLSVLVEIYWQDVRSFLKTYPVVPALPKLTSDHGLPDESLSSPMTCTRVPLASCPTIVPLGVVLAFA